MFRIFRPKSLIVRWLPRSERDRCVRISEGAKSLCLKIARKFVRPLHGECFILVQAAGLLLLRIEAEPDGTLVFVPRDATTIGAQPTENQNEWDAA